MALGNAPKGPNGKLASNVDAVDATL